jgi:hypothetical protein
MSSEYRAGSAQLRLHLFVDHGRWTRPTRSYEDGDVWKVLRLMQNCEGFTATP